jgi:hypothetical protein
VSFIAGGGNTEQVLDLADVVDAVGMMVDSKRVPHWSKWCDNDGDDSSIEGLF